MFEIITIPLLNFNEFKSISIIFHLIIQTNKNYNKIFTTNTIDIYTFYKIYTRNYKNWGFNNFIYLVDDSNKINHFINVKHQKIFFVMY